MDLVNKVTGKSDDSQESKVEQLLEKGIDKAQEPFTGQSEGNQSQSQGQTDLADKANTEQVSEYLREQYRSKPGDGLPDEATQTAEKKAEEADQQ